MNNELDVDRSKLAEWKAPESKEKKPINRLSKLTEHIPGTTANKEAAERADAARELIKATVDAEQAALHTSSKEESDVFMNTMLANQKILQNEFGLSEKDLGFAIIDERARRSREKREGRAKESRREEVLEKLQAETHIHREGSALREGKSGEEIDGHENPERWAKDTRELMENSRVGKKVVQQELAKKGWLERKRDRSEMIRMLSDTLDLLDARMRTLQEQGLSKEHNILQDPLMRELAREIKILSTHLDMQGVEDSEISDLMRKYKKSKLPLPDRFKTFLQETGVLTK